MSHIFFADDSYVFCWANECEAIRVQELSSIFEKASGQKINFDKSSIFFSNNTSVNTHDEVCGLLGIHEADEQSTYLGLPNIIGRKKSIILGYLKDIVRQRIQSWDGKFLSKAGKEILLKTAAQSLPNFSMSVFLLPLDLCKEVERLMCRYWWQGSPKKDKGIHWMSWGRMCRSKINGGLGFRHMHDFNVSLLGKQGWRLLTQPHSLVNRIYKA